MKRQTRREALSRQLRQKDRDAEIFIQKTKPLWEALIQFAKGENWVQSEKGFIWAGEDNPQELAEIAIGARDPNVKSEAVIEVGSKQVG